MNMKIAILPSKRPYSKDKSIQSIGKRCNLFNRIQNTAKQKDVVWLKAVVHIACFHYDNLLIRLDHILSGIPPMHQ